MDHRLTLLLLPGMLCDAAFWRAQIEELSDICVPLVVAYGLLNSIEAMAEAVLAKAPARFAIAGHSMGGRVAQEVYRRAPERVLRLALLATDYRGQPGADARRAEERRRADILAIARKEGMEGFARGWLKQILPPERLADARLVSDVVGMMARHSPDVLASQTEAGLNRPDFTEMLPRVDCPTLICAGARDTFRPVGVHREMAAKIRGSRLVVLENTAHMPAMETPAAVTTAMRQWLAA